VEGVGEAAEAVGGRETIAEQTLQSCIGSEHGHVIVAVSPSGHEQHDRLDLLVVGQASVALLQMKVFACSLLEPQRSHGLSDQGKAGVTGQRIARWHGFNSKRQDALLLGGHGRLDVNTLACVHAKRLRVYTCTDIQCLGSPMRQGNSTRAKIAANEACIGVVVRDGYYPFKYTYIVEQSPFPRGGGRAGDGGFSRDPRRRLICLAA